MNNRERRIFIKKASVLFAGGVVYSALPIVSACKKESIYDSYFVEKPKCIGCGDCLEACYHDAIDLPVLSSYFIVFHDCSDCGKCVPYCDQGAIKISQIDYNFIGENCVGCGNCIDVCQDEGNCISYEREEYKIKGKCNTNKCQEECFDSTCKCSFTLSKKIFQLTGTYSFKSAYEFTFTTFATFLLVNFSIVNKPFYCTVIGTGIICKAIPTTCTQICIYKCMVIIGRYNSLYCIKFTNIVT